MPEHPIDPLSDSIWIRCEGSQRATVGPFGSCICSMCGSPFPRSNIAPKHHRRDILAEMDRGDFDVS